MPWLRLFALTLVSLAKFPALKDPCGDDGCGAGGRSFSGHNGARVDTCVAERRQSRRPAHVPVFHHHTGQRQDCARPQSDTKELSTPAYIHGARKSRIHRLQTARDCTPQ